MKPKTKSDTEVLKSLTLRSSKSDTEVLKSDTEVLKSDTEVRGRGFSHRLADAKSLIYLPNDVCKTDPDLATVMAAWPELPEAIKADIVVMVKAT